MTAAASVGASSGRESLQRDLWRHDQFDRRVEAFGDEPQQQLVELLEVAGIAVEQETPRLHVRPAQTTVDEFVDERIGNETPARHALARAVAELRPGADGITQQITGRHVGNPEKARDAPGLRSLAGPGGADDEQPHLASRSGANGLFGPTMLRAGSAGHPRRHEGYAP